MISFKQFLYEAAAPPATPAPAAPAAPAVPAAPASPGSNPNGVNPPPNPSPGDTYTTPSGTTFVFANGRWRLVSTAAPPKPDQKPSKPKPPVEKPKPATKPAPRPRQPGQGETTDPGYIRLHPKGSRPW